MINSDINVVLASASPRRRELLSRVIPFFSVIPSDINEDEGAEFPEEIVMLLAANKAKKVAPLCPCSLIIGADTIVVHRGKILNKPQTTEEAYEMLSGLSGESHLVYTGVCIIYKERAVSFFEVSKVDFRAIDGKEIDAYIESGSPFDKAGGYGIQDSDFVCGYTGSLFNVMGLPVERLEIELNKFIRACSR